MHTGARFATELRADVQFAEQLFSVDLNELNVSGVDGTALLARRGNELTVFIAATGLTPGQTHPQHIHGFANDQIVARTPTIAFDDSALGGDEDGYVELAEGLDTYGPVLFNLAPFPTAPNGSVTFATTYNLTDQQLATLQPLQIREIVLHGMNVLPGVGAGTPGEVNGTGGYTGILPVASGEVRTTSREAAFTLLDQAGVGASAQFGVGVGEIRPVGHRIENAFDFEFYLGNNPDVAAAGVDALVHYNTFGFKEGRDPNAYFDTSGYLEAYDDVAAAGVNPLRHYLEFGAREGRDPSTAFDTTAYLAAYPDVAAGGVNPLNHFLQFGIYEGRGSFGDGAFDFA
jgi:hypothetical protein